MKSKIIAVDFDGTLCEAKWPEIGQPNEELIAYLLVEQVKGSKLILWTCRTGEKLQQAVDWCKEQGLVFNAVNENIPEIIAAFEGESRKIFANEYIDDLNSARFKLPYVKDDRGMSAWAEREVKIACERERASRTEEDDKFDPDWDYGCACYESALKAFRSLCTDGHSGMSIGIAKQILNRLIDGKPLTPIEDTPDSWNHIWGCDGSNDTKYQCKRMSSLFKDIYSDGTVKYKDVDRVRMYNIGSNIPWSNGFISNLIHEMYPITMPYIPDEKPYKVYVEEFLTDRKNGDYDTVGVSYAIKPDGERVDISRYFKDSAHAFEEISIGEYVHRKEMKIDD